MDKAKILSRGRSQAVRLPPQYQFEGQKEVYIRRDLKTGEVILSAKPQDWSAFIALRDSLDVSNDEDIQSFLSDRNDPPPPKRDLF